MPTVKITDELAKKVKEERIDIGEAILWMIEKLEKEAK